MIHLICDIIGFTSFIIVVMVAIRCIEDMKYASQD